MSFTKALRSPFEHFFKSKDPVAAAISPDPTRNSDWSPGCYTFRDYWLSLRDGQVMPTSARLLDDCSPEFVGVMYIIELSEGGPVVRMQGLQLEAAWSRDLTGQDFFPGRSQRFRECAAANMKQVLEHPCGHLARSTYATSKGRKITSDWIQLPLAVNPGRPPRIVGAVFQPIDHNLSETSTQHFELHKLGWIDAGCGVPNEAPTPLVE